MLQIVTPRNENIDTLIFPAMQLAQNTIKLTINDLTNAMIYLTNKSIIML